MNTEQEILTVKQAAKLTPWSEATLYRIAKRDPNSPFRRVWNQIVTTREDLMEWVRSAPSPALADPMPQPDLSLDDMVELVRSTKVGGR